MTYLREVFKKEIYSLPNFSEYCIDGCTLDNTKDSSLVEFNNDGTFFLHRSKIGRLWYDIKYQKKYYNIIELASLIADPISFITNKYNINVIVPIPSIKYFEPLNTLFYKVSMDINIQFNSGSLIKTHHTRPMKLIKDSSKRRELLSNAYRIKDMHLLGKSILIVDDHFRSGDTLKYAIKTIHEFNSEIRIYALTLTSNIISHSPALFY